MSRRAGTVVDHASLPLVASPSGLPTQHLVSQREGATALFVGQQWLRRGERVLLHTHPVEEALTVLTGSGTATIGGDQVSIGAGVSLFIPPGVVHGFACVSEETMQVMIVFPVPHFAETTLVEVPHSGNGP